MHIVSRIGADDTVTELSVMASVIGAIEGLHGSGQDAIPDGCSIAVIIVVIRILAIFLYEGHVIANIHRVFCGCIADPVFSYGSSQEHIRVTIDHIQLGRQ